MLHCFSEQRNPSSVPSLQSYTPSHNLGTSKHFVLLSPWSHCNDGKSQLITFSQPSSSLPSSQSISPSHQKGIGMHFCPFIQALSLLVHCMVQLPWFSSDPSRQSLVPLQTKSDGTQEPSPQVNSFLSHRLVSWVGHFDSSSPIEQSFARWTLGSFQYTFYPHGSKIGRNHSFLDNHLFSITSIVFWNAFVAISNELSVHTGGIWTACKNKECISWICQLFICLGLIQCLKMKVPVCKFQHGIK